MIAMIIVFVILIIVLFKGPNQEEKASHIATLCNVMRDNPTLKNDPEIFEQFEFMYGNSTPSYAYKRPKFYDEYAHELIQKFLVLSEAQQVQAKQSYQQCFNWLD